MVIQTYNICDIWHAAEKQKNHIWNKVKEESTQNFNDTQITSWLNLRKQT